MLVRTGVVIAAHVNVGGASPLTGPTSVDLTVGRRNGAGIDSAEVVRAAEAATARLGPVLAAVLA